MIPHGEFGKERVEILSVNQPTDLRMFAMQRHTQQIALRLLTLHKTSLGGSHTVAQQHIPLQPARHTVQLLGGIANGIQTTHNSTDTRAHHHIYGHSRLFNHLDRTNMRRPFRSATAQHERHLLTLALFRPSLLGNKHHHAHTNKQAQGTRVYS